MHYFEYFKVRVLNYAQITSFSGFYPDHEHGRIQGEAVQARIRRFGPACLPLSKILDTPLTMKLACKFLSMNCI